MGLRESRRIERLTRPGVKLLPNGDFLMAIGAELVQRSYRKISPDYTITEIREVNLGVTPCGRISIDRLERCARKLPRARNAT